MSRRPKERSAFKTGIDQLRAFGVTVVLVAAYLAIVAFLRGQSGEAIVQSLSRIDVLLAIALSPAAFLIAGRWRHYLVWFLISFAASLIWGSIGIPFVFVKPLENFSLAPAFVTLLMSLLFCYSKPWNSDTQAMRDRAKR